MKPTTYFILAVLLCCGCASSKNGINEILSGKWELSFFPTTEQSFDEVFGHRRPELDFDVVRSQVSGSTGCNRLSGSFTANNNHFSFGPDLSTTRMSCPDYDEQAYLQALHSVNRYEVLRGQLRLLHDGHLVMSFRRKP
ncbi:MAG: META domain-containing protein [Flavisolibacter sp.]